MVAGVTIGTSSASWFRPQRQAGETADPGDGHDRRGARPDPSCRACRPSRSRGRVRPDFQMSPPAPALKPLSLAKTGRRNRAATGAERGGSGLPTEPSKAGGERGPQSPADPRWMAPDRKTGLRRKRYQVLETPMPKVRGSV